MKLFALQNSANDQLRTIRKKQFNLHSQQKLIYKDIVKQCGNVDFKKKQFYRIIVNGVPSEFRSQVWSALIPNVYSITQQGYQKIVLDVDQIIVDYEKQKCFQKNNNNYAFEKLSTNSVRNTDSNKRYQLNKNNVTFSSQRMTKITSALSKLEQDLPRTFPDLPDFHNEPEYYKKLKRILCVLVAIRSDIGYIQGMSHIGALFLLQINSQYQSFLAMATIISKSPLNDFFTFDQKKIKVICLKIEEKIKILSSQLMQYLLSSEIETKMLAVSWIMTLFTKCFQVDSILNIWDILLANNLSQNILVQLCASLVIVRKKVLLLCSNPGQMIKTLLHSRLDLIEQEWVLQYLRGLPCKLQ